jgi:GNAT superfamily N-acetyltransferase
MNRPRTSLREVPANGAEAVGLIAELDAEILSRYPGLPTYGLHPGEHADPRLRFFVLEQDGVPVGCGAVRELQPGVAELKRMFVRRPHRGRSLGRALLTGLEERARAANIRVMRLETASLLTEAIALYRSAGYHDIPQYGQYVGDPLSMCMEKRLSGNE